MCIVSSLQRFKFSILSVALIASVSVKKFKITNPNFISPFHYWPQLSLYYDLVIE